MPENLEAKALAALAEVLDEKVTAAPDTPLEDIPGWSSLKYIQWVSTLEDQFDVEFDTEEHEGFQTFGQVCEAVRRKLG